MQDRDGAPSERLGRCDADRCSREATLWCHCECGKKFCEEHELAERRAWQIRQAQKLIAHRNDPAVSEYAAERDADGRRDKIAARIGARP